MQKHKRLWDAYRFPGFSPEHTLSGVFGDPRSRILGLIRRGKKLSVGPVAWSIIPFTTGRSARFATCPVPICAFTWPWRSGAWPVEVAGK